MANRDTTYDNEERALRRNQQPANPHQVAAKVEQPRTQAATHNALEQENADLRRRLDRMERQLNNQSGAQTLQVVQPKENLQKANGIQSLENRPPTVTPVQMMQDAMAMGNTITAETIQAMRAMFELEIDYRAKMAEQTFNRDFSAWKALGIQAERTVMVDYQTSKGRTTYMHDDLGVTLQKVNETMAPFGLSVRFRYEQSPRDEGWPPGTVRTFAVCAHRDGHKEETFFDAEPDTSGSKNNIQARGSSGTYGQRYALNALLGIAPPKKTDESLLGISQDDIAAIQTALNEQGKSAQELCQFLGQSCGAHIESLADIKRAQYVLVQRWLHIDPNHARQQSKKAADLESQAPARKPSKKKTSRKKTTSKAGTGQ